MYISQPTLVLGFHGCDQTVAEEILAGRTRLLSSRNEYDWLGSGIYFWEGNPQRADEYARLLQSSPKRTRGSISRPFVLGAVIDLGYCLNLLDSWSLQLLAESHETLAAAMQSVGKELPRNVPLGDDNELLLRPLDCAVIESLHAARETGGERPFDSVRAIFPEGKPLYEGAGFRRHSHVQICVRNPNCIKGYFRVLEPVEGFAIP